MAMGRISGIQSLYISHYIYTDVLYFERKMDMVQKLKSLLYSVLLHNLT